MFIEEIDATERTLGDMFGEFGKKLGKICELGYDILEDKELSDKERSDFVDVLANVKGAKMATYKLMEKYSDVPQADLKKIKQKADDFVAGLGIKE